MININVLSEDKVWSNKIKRKNFFFNSLCNHFPRKYKFINKKVGLTLLLSNNKKIKKLNKRFRNKNKATDILSFPFSDKVNLKKNNYLGDIIISYNFMNDSKSKKNSIFEKRVIKTFIHGFLHLLGYDHIKNHDHKKMVKEEKKIYQSVISKLN